MELSAVLKNKIVDFLILLPGMTNKRARQALIGRASLDTECEVLIEYEQPVAQFFQLLVPKLDKYGKLKDDRDALEAVLTSAKNYVGQDGRDDCETLLHDLRRSRQTKTELQGEPATPGRTEKQARHSSAFVPGYTYDIFVSYAHVDDKPRYGKNEGWVTTFIKELKLILAQRLGSEDVYSLWSDHQMPGNIPISDMLRILRESATLIVILSPGYLASEWCQRQQNDFLQTIRQQIRSNSRIFVVERDRLEPEERPPEFADLRGYQFWIEDRKGKPPRVLGDPAPHRDEELYYERLNDLVYDLAKELRRLKASAVW